MGKEKFPRFSDIPWSKIKEFRVSSNDSAYSFEFDIHGKKQKMTIKVEPGSTQFTLSSMDGKPIVHATQKGGDITILDFSSQPKRAGASGKLKSMGKIKKATAD